MPTIESILHETRCFEPPHPFTENARIKDRATYDALVEEATQDWDGFWARRAREEITWITPFTKPYRGDHATRHTWFEDGVLNASVNCLDRHLGAHRHKPAIIFEGDDGATEIWSYLRMHQEVCRFANGIKEKGIQRGDRVVIYMPMHPRAVVAMLACARIGAIHSVVFAGFSTKALKDRIADTGAKMVITADEAVRGGKTIPLKQTVDLSLPKITKKSSVKTVVVMRRTQADIFMKPGRDLFWEELTHGQPDICPPEPMGSEDPLFILYTSGSTGKPKGILHTTAGYLLGAILSMKWVFDYQSDDIFWCTADVGWITGHTYVAYGPMAVGATQLIFEGTPTHPHAGRFWEVVEKHRVTTFYTAPTAIRSLIKTGKELPKSYNLSSLRLLGSVGEPINPEAWIWYKETVGENRCPVVDTWWQTETGSHMIAPLPGALATKPGSCTLPLPGIFASVVDETGHELGPGQGGLLVIKKPWPSQLRTIWGDDERYRKNYFLHGESGKSFYLASDSAVRDEEGYFWIMGRMDDVLTVSGHRLGTMEIESSLVASPGVAEAAVVARPDDLTGEAIVAFVVPHGACPTGQAASQMAEELRQWVTQEIGAIAKPREIRFGDNLPKTRSGKIMRRLLRLIAKGEAISQDTSTLENPAILEQLKESL